MNRKKKSKQERVPLSQVDELTHNPFAQFAKSLGVTPPASEEPAPKSEIEPSHPVSVSLHVRKEKRTHGKVVTCIRHFQGDRKALLRELRKHLATGGTLEGDILVVQGDHVKRVCDWLQQKGYKTRGS